MNFLTETKRAIKGSGHKPDDIMFIGSLDGEYRISWDKFKDIAAFDYDNGFGGQEIASDLIIYFKDHTYITRGEYDGSEWWQYNIILQYNEDDEYKDFNYLKGDYNWSTVEELNNIKEIDEEV